MQIQFTSGRLSVGAALPSDAVLHQTKKTSGDVLTDAFRSPLGLPALGECVVPEDRVVVVPDPDAPEAGRMIVQILEELAASGYSLNITLLLPQDPSGEQWERLLCELPSETRNSIAVRVHNPADEQQRRYLASSGGGDRIYLSQHLTDADLIITVGSSGFDSLLGYRGAGSLLYPAFSDAASIADWRRRGHAELTPDDPRPLRELVDEIGWLLGTQFTVQVVPDSQGAIGYAACGAADAVMAATREVLQNQWRIRTTNRFPLVIISVPGDLRSNGWKRVGTAVEMASRLAEDGGRIVVIADVPRTSGDAMEALRRCQDAELLSSALRREPSADAVEVMQLIEAQQQTTVYLLSRLPAESVEDLGMVPLADDRELQRLIDQADRVMAVPGADCAWVDTSVARV